MELGHIAEWIVGSILLAAGTMLIGYALGLKAGTRSSVAKDLRILAQEQRIARLEKAIAEPSAAYRKIHVDARQRGAVR